MSEERIFLKERCTHTHTHTHTRLYFLPESTPSLHNSLLSFSLENLAASPKFTLKVGHFHLLTTQIWYGQRNWGQKVTEKKKMKDFRCPQFQKKNLGATNANTLATLFLQHAAVHKAWVPHQAEWAAPQLCCTPASRSTDHQAPSQ
jgi:hypothetical protein